LANSSHLNTTVYQFRCEFSLAEGSASAQAAVGPLVWGAGQALAQDANRSRSVVTSRGLSW